jgi:hypothetical protein
LSEPEIDDLVAFMASLTSREYAELGAKELARRRDIARTDRPQRDTARAFGPKPPSATAVNRAADLFSASAISKRQWSAYGHDAALRSTTNPAV